MWFVFYGHTNDTCKRILWWRHLGFVCVCVWGGGGGGGVLVTDGFPSQRASNASFDVFVGVSLNKRLNEWRVACDLRRQDAHCDVIVMSSGQIALAFSGSYFLRAYTASYEMMEYAQATDWSV